MVCRFDVCWVVEEGSCSQLQTEFSNVKSTLLFQLVSEKEVGVGDNGKGQKDWFFAIAFAGGKRTTNRERLSGMGV